MLKPYQVKGRAHLQNLGQDFYLPQELINKVYTLGMFCDSHLHITQYHIDAPQNSFNMMHFQHNIPKDDLYIAQHQINISKNNLHIPKYSIDMPKNDL